MGLLAIMGSNPAPVLYTYWAEDLNGLLDIDYMCQCLIGIGCLWWGGFRQRGPTSDKQKEDLTHHAKSKIRCNTTNKQDPTDDCSLVSMVV